MPRNARTSPNSHVGTPASIGHCPCVDLRAHTGFGMPGRRRQGSKRERGGPRSDAEDGLSRTPTGFKVPPRRRESPPAAATCTIGRFEAGRHFPTLPLSTTACRCLASQVPQRRVTTDAPKFRRGVQHNCRNVLAAQGLSLACHGFFQNALVLGGEGGYISRYALGSRNSSDGRRRGTYVRAAMAVSGLAERRCAVCPVQPRKRLLGSDKGR